MVKEFDRKIVLEDGEEYFGYAFGAVEEKVSEIVFNTSMVGYQEIISDPSYTEQTVVMTYPLIGNYGLTDEDYETKKPTISGLIVREYNDFPSNFRYTKTLGELMEENHISYLQLYASDGKKIAEGVIYPQNSGFPVSIALSSDGKLLMVSEIDISEKKISSRVVFYNFGRVGQNESDNIVASYLYEDETIPDVCFMKDDTPIAYSGETIHIFSKSEKPKESKEIKYESKIRSIENDGSNFVVITENDNPEDSNAYLLEVFNKSGHRIGKRSFDYSYDSVSILPGSQIVIIDGNKINFLVFMLSCLLVCLFIFLFYYYLMLYQN